MSLFPVKNQKVIRLSAHACAVLANHGPALKVQSREPVIWLTPAASKTKMAEDSEDSLFHCWVKNNGLEQCQWYQELLLEKKGLEHKSQEDLEQPHSDNWAETRLEQKDQEPEVTALEPERRMLPFSTDKMLRVVNVLQAEVAAPEDTTVPDGSAASIDPVADDFQNPKDTDSQTNDASSVDKTSTRSDAQPHASEMPEKKTEPVPVGQQVPSSSANEDESAEKSFSFNFLPLVLLVLTLCCGLVAVVTFIVVNQLEPTASGDVKRQSRTHVFASEP